MKYLGFTILLFLLSGCGSEQTVAQVCADNPALCNDLNKDSHCNLQRRSVIFDRVAEKKLPSDNNKYNLLISFEKYSKCIELAAGIEHIKLKEKKTSRVDGLLTSLNEIKRLSEETVSSDDPRLLAFHWSRYQSQPHLERFLQAEQAGQLQTPELLLTLASYYMKRDLPKTIDILHRALKRTAADEKVDPEIYTALTTIYFKQRNYPMSYIWAVVAEDAGIERIEFSRIRTLLSEQKYNLSTLNAQAEATIESIAKGRFVAPVLPN